MIIDAFKSFGLPFDEGATTDGETGIYGPYRQSQRAEIYQTFVKSLVQRGMAYPCFCTEEELSAAHEQQEKNKEKLRLLRQVRRMARPSDGGHRGRACQGHAVCCSFPLGGQH